MLGRNLSSVNLHAPSPHYSREFVTKPLRRHTRRACGAVRPRGVLEQYVEGVSGEPARRGLVAAASPRL